MHIQPQIANITHLFAKYNTPCLFQTVQFSLKIVIAQTTYWGSLCSWAPYLYFCACSRWRSKWRQHWREQIYEQLSTNHLSLSMAVECASWSVWHLGQGYVLTTSVPLWKCLSQKHRMNHGQWVLAEQPGNFKT